MWWLKTFVTVCAWTVRIRDGCSVMITRQRITNVQKNVIFLISSAAFSVFLKKKNTLCHQKTEKITLLSK